MTITASTHKYSKFIQHIFKKFYIRMSRKIALHYFIGHKYLACFMKCLNYNFKLYMFQLLTTNSLPSVQNVENIGVTSSEFLLMIVFELLQTVAVLLLQVLQGVLSASTPGSI